MNILSKHKSLIWQIGFSTLLSVAINLDAQAAQSCKQNIIIPSTPASDFVLDARGTVTHLKTGLMWMRCSLGQTWDGTSCNGFPSNYSWQGALQEADKFNFSGYSDWRLPNKNELVSIVEVSCVDPTINSALFPNTPIAYYWTSTPFAAILDHAWSVHFNNGYVTNELKRGKLHIRLVRGGR